MDACYSCSQNAAPDRAPREDVDHDEYWRAALAFDSALPGWLVLAPRRHVTTIAELTEPEAATLGAWLRRLSLALHVETGCAKTYVMQFSEAEGFSHLHFHVVPRASDIPADRVGPRVFGYLGRPEADRRPVAAQDELAVRLGRVIAGM